MSQQLRKRNGEKKQQQRATLELLEESDEDMKCDRRSVMMGYCGGCFTGALFIPLYIVAARAYGVHQ